MDKRILIVRLDGEDLDGDASSLLLYRLESTVEVVATEEHGADAVVVLSREQARNLARSLTAAIDVIGGEYGA